MDAPSRTFGFLASVPAFAGLGADQLARLYGCTVLKVLAKGEIAVAAGAAVNDLAIVVSGRIAAEGGGPEAVEFGQGAVLNAEAFFTQTPAAAALIAVRETVLLTLARDELTAAFQGQPDLLGALFGSIGASRAPFAQARPYPARLVLCCAGSKGSVDAEVRDAFIASLEDIAEVRVLRRDSFGSLALDAPDTAHWLQEQELDFDVTILAVDSADMAFAKASIDEADEILFLACGGTPALSALEQYALERRGGHRCRLVIAQGNGISAKSAADWIALRPYRSTQFLALAPPAATLMASDLLGRGTAVAATSCGVFAAAILGALQALEANGVPATSLTAAGSAVLPASLLACGVSLAETEAVFRELANPQVWKRAGRPDSGLYDAGPIDTALASTLPEGNIALAARAFRAVSHSLSAGRPEVHREGRLQTAVRAGLTPPGLLPPLILDNGDILVSGETEIGPLIEAAAHLSSSPPVLLHASVPALGPSEMSYRQLAGGTLFRLTAFQIDKRLRLETVLGALSQANAVSLLKQMGVQSLAIPIPEGIGPMDWGEWARLRDSAFAWTSAEIEGR